jgi:hypothetical protein
VVDLARMNAGTRIILFVLLSAAAAAQVPPAQPSAGTQSSDLGFSYNVPNDWEVLGTPATLAKAKSEASQNAGSEEEKKGLGCLEPVLTARDRKSDSFLSVEALPFACFGQQMTEDDLPGFASAAPEVLKQNFDLGQPVSGTYNLGTHKMWVERVPATLRNHPELLFTVEVACGLLKKAAVCWMAVAGNENALHAIEGAAVTLDGEPPAALVPSGAFGSKPS